MEQTDKILITGAAGFIGSYLAEKLLKEQFQVIGIDNLNDYYDVRLKEERLKKLDGYTNFKFIRMDIADAAAMKELFEREKPDIVVNLAAQAGVRYSITNPDAYIQSNLIGFYNVLECCRHSYDNGNTGVKHLVLHPALRCMAQIKSTLQHRGSGGSSGFLICRDQKSNELLAYSYGKLYGIPVTGLRFFTVYGPMGRPDMAYFGFTNKMVKGEKIQIYNHGDMYRDFTYIDDIVNGVYRVMGKAPQEDENGVKYKIYNIGNNQPESLMYFVETLETCLQKAGVISKSAEKEFLPMQPGDVYQTYADVSELEKDFDFRPSTPLSEGLQRFADWYAEYYKK